MSAPEPTPQGPDSPPTELGVDELLTTETLTQIATERELSQPVDFRELVAKTIAVDIVKIFMYTVLGSLSAGFIVLLSLCVILWRTPASAVTAAALMKDVLVPFIASIGTLASTVFGPLLAFILGYYFGEKSGGNSFNGTRKR